MYKVKRFSAIDQKMDMMTEQREFGNPANKAAKRFWEGKLALINNHGYDPKLIDKELLSLPGSLNPAALVKEGRRINKYKMNGYDPLEMREIFTNRVKIASPRPLRDFHEPLRDTLAGKSGLSRIG